MCAKVKAIFLKFLSIIPFTDGSGNFWAMTSLSFSSPISPSSILSRFCKTKNYSIISPFLFTFPCYILQENRHSIWKILGQLNLAKIDFLRDKFWQTFYRQPCFYFICIFCGLDNCFFSENVFISFYRGKLVELYGLLVTGECRFDRTIHWVM